MIRGIGPLVVFALGCCWATVMIGEEKQAKSLKSGKYNLYLRATEGSHRGAKAEGVVTLVAVTESDRSPRTGEIAKDRPGGPPLLYGWTNTDLKRVGAPLCSDRPHPSPDSNDPVYPGIIVERVPYGPDGPFTGRSEVSAVLVGTLSSLRNGEVWTDGCGFGMFVLAWNGQCYTGKWSEWGLKHDGRGEFRLCPK
jgi:hypothetical protein